MAHRIIFAPEALEDLRSLTAYYRAAVADGIETHLAHQPERVSRSRIKRLRGMAQPQYRLRIGDVRVFYDVVEDEVLVLAIVGKAQAAEWLEVKGIEA
jgi:mRNA-degrading endonuclease RelE of RelBE toxin-antitoxin system